MPHHAVEVRGSEDAALTERLAALRVELDLPGGFAAPVLAEAEESAAAVLASTPTIERTLNAHGLARVRRWGRGVAGFFTPEGARDPLPLLR